MLRRPRPDPDATSASRSWLGSPLGAATAARLTTIAVWGLVACGPLALLTTSLLHAKPVSTGTPAAPSAGAAVLGPTGFAQLYVAAYLRSGGSSVSAFFPDAPDMTGQPASRSVTATTVVAVDLVSPGYWSVTVAVTEAAADPVHYFQVPVQTADGSGSQSYVATALPAEVAGPGQASAAQVGYDTGLAIPPGPVTAAVTQFLAAYLTGSGNLSRYLGPGTALAPVRPAPYASIQSVTVYPQNGASPDAAGPPPSGSRLRVLAQVQAADSGAQQWPLTYALTLTAVAGQWDIAAVDLAPALATSPAKGR